MARFTGGWIKVYRTLGDNDMSRDPFLTHTWMHLLIDANLFQSKIRWLNNEHTLERGQVLLSFRAYAKQIGVSYQVLRRCVAYLEKTTRIVTETNAGGTIVTILKFNEKQMAGDSVNAPIEENQRTPNAPSTHDQRTPNAIMNNIIKEERKKGRIKEVACAEAQADQDHTVEPLILEAMPKKSAKEQTPGSYAFECFSKHYEARYGIKPLRDRMANVHAKAIGESIPREDVDKFFECYLANPNSFYVQKAHQINFARTDVQKIYTEMQTGARFSMAKAKQYELVSENQQVMDRFMAKERVAQNGR